MPKLGSMMEDGKMMTDDMNQNNIEKLFLENWLEDGSPVALPIDQCKPPLRSIKKEHEPSKWTRMSETDLQHRLYAWRKKKLTTSSGKNVAEL